ncbi:MAG: hydrogenase maturation nickel metallochaperone HypA [Pseudomonadota bacterium]
MHEMSIAQSLIDIIREEMVKHDAKAIRSVRLSIGQMTAIVPDSLSFCFEVITAGTELEGAKLIMEIVPLRGYCHSCDSEFEIKDYAFACPSCGSTEIKTIAGQDLSIVEMEVD